MAYRTWKRDGSTNYLELAEAAKNLQMHGYRGTVKELVSQLKRGRVFETPAAFYSAVEVHGVEQLSLSPH